MRIGTRSLAVLATAVFFHFISADSTIAQTLTEQLSAEDPAKLVELARRDGNSVRGAILFHQGNINCAKCHRPTAEKDRLGPNLSRIDPKTTDEYIVESILQPSKIIKEGYETFIGLTNDGKTANGIIVSQDDKELVIRDSQNVDKLIRIAREDLDELQPGKKSSMPDDLANELKDRRQFLDLLRYVLEIKDRGPDEELGTAETGARRELSAELKGLVLMQKSNCSACHQDDSLHSPVAAKKAPKLKWSAKWLNPNYIESFIENPEAIKPGTTMPGLLGQLDDQTRKSSAKAIAHFLASKADNEFQQQPIDSQAAGRGFELFHSIGCVACHSPRNENAVELPLADSTPLGDLTRKHNVSGLSQFLEDPLAVRQSGHMPNMQLTHFEAIEIANYLLQASKPVADWKLDADLAKQGETLFAKYDCIKCHTDFTGETSPLTAPTISKLNPEQGCLSENNGVWPNFHFQPADRQSIQAALKTIPLKLDDQQRIDVTLATFNCVACHARSDLGGISDARNPHFKTTNLNLGDQGRIPPTLTGVGAKLKTNWLRDVLVNARTIRPYMKTRMPQYGEDNIGHLPKLFADSDRIAKTDFVQFKDQKEMRTKGLELAGNKGLNCVACHTYQYKLSDTMPAVDLTEMTDRLKKDWFYQYMLSPQKFSPNTVMPSFWPGGQAIRKDIEGSPEENVEALWQYLIDGRQARAPRGVVREPLEIVVTDEAQILRRSFPGIGKRGIGVGYPGGVNIAFDAEQLRLALVWKGKFADPSGAWRGQGNGNVRPMSRPIEFTKGPDLDHKSNPWVVDDGRPPNRQFRGYSLDNSQRPTFRYGFDSVEVQDFFSESTNNETKSVRLRRSVEFESKAGQGNLNFRIASGPELKADDGNMFSIGQQLKVRIVSDHQVKISENDDQKRLEILLELKPNEKQNLEIEYFWD